MITEHQVHFQTGSRTKRELAIGSKPELPTGRIPRVAKMMALAIRFDQQIRDGLVKDQAELARCGYVSRARLSQIMLLLQLAPVIQEWLLFLPRVVKGNEPILERDLREIASDVSWTSQVAKWHLLQKSEVRASR